MVITVQRVRITVQGRVQNVGFRYFTYQAALNRQLVGFVKNEPDGSVLIEAEGALASIYSLVNDLGKGPRMASVTSIDVQKLDSQGIEKEFKIESW